MHLIPSTPFAPETRVSKLLLTPFLSAALLSRSLWLDKLHLNPTADL